MGGLVLVDATPEPVVDDAGVRAGYTLLGLLATTLEAMSPVGVTRLLIERSIVIPERQELARLLSVEEYRAWIADLCQTVADGGARDELGAVIYVTKEVKCRRQNVVEPEFGDLPMRVLTSSAFGERWIEWQRQLAARSSNGVQRLTGTRSHNVHLRYPELVVDAIDEVVGRAFPR